MRFFYLGGVVRAYRNQMSYVCQCSDLWSLQISFIKIFEDLRCNSLPCSKQIAGVKSVKPLKRRLKGFLCNINKPKYHLSFLGVVSKFPRTRLICPPGPRYYKVSLCQKRHSDNFLHNLFVLSVKT